MNDLNTENLTECYVCGKEIKEEQVIEFCGAETCSDECYEELYNDMASAAGF